MLSHSPRDSSANTATRYFQDFFTELISTRSSGLCAPLIFGPKEIMSILPTHSPIRPHSSPAWIAATLGSSPNKSA